MADDPELEAIRQQRMRQMMGQYGGQMPTQEEAQKQQEQQKAQEEQRQAMLTALLQPQARERLARIALVKPDKARGVENLVINLAQRGQLAEKVSEERLIGMLEQINERASAGTKVTITRRRNIWDDDE